MKASDYIAQRIKKETDIVFGITGGAIVNLFDSLDKKGIKIILTHHEQAAAMCADAYSRVSGKLGVVIVTSGPGATNLITGTCCSWFDSIPVLAIAGQVPTNQLKSKKLRQRGFQETDTVTLFKSITKFSKRVKNVKKDLDQAIEIAKTDRKGPVFLELCDDTQRKDI
jgi:acetolactate synthase-1/2/3 large subunit